MKHGIIIGKNKPANLSLNNLQKLLNGPYCPYFATPLAKDDIKNQPEIIKKHSTGV
ncbi:MAG: hypothetical protein MJ233_02195 [Mycoplasmoidaceae bacterium]|nr:hypothetical protein [Mycoplasmoidaceae bacterium]